MRLCKIDYSCQNKQFPVVIINISKFLMFVIMRTDIKLKSLFNIFFSLFDCKTNFINLTLLINNLILNICRHYSVIASIYISKRKIKYRSIIVKKKREKKTFQTIPQNVLLLVILLQFLWIFYFCLFDLIIIHNISL